MKYESTPSLVERLLKRLQTAQSLGQNISMSAVTLQSYKIIVQSVPSFPKWSVFMKAVQTVAQTVCMLQETSNTESCILHCGRRSRCG